MPLLVRGIFYGDKMEEYCIYLRKSRADLEAEAQGEGETLARHERTLLELARRGNYNITEIYREIVSGETITSRPVVTQLLREVEAGRWSGVLVMEVERLARGDAIDQGTVARAFKYSGTRIITPMKVYDPSNQFDEEYFEFGLFMSRQEYRTINRRLNAGRLAAVKEGKIVAGGTPYGYERVHVQNGKGFTLRIVEDEAAVIRMIFRLYAYGDTGEDGNPVMIGCDTIAHRLDAFGIPSPAGNGWEGYTIRYMLKNPAYIGKVRWGRNKTKKIVVDGIPASKRYIDAKGALLVDGLHEPIISSELWDAVQTRISSGSPRVNENMALSNPFAGIARCGYCGRVLYRRAGDGDSVFLKCPKRGCQNHIVDFYVFEKRLISALEEWLAGYRLDWSAESSPESSAIAAAESSIATAKKNISQLEAQLDRTHSLLEQGVYSTETFLERSRLLTERIASARDALAGYEDDLVKVQSREANRENFVPAVEKLIDVYWSLPSASAKNEMLKEVLEKVEYRRENKGRRGGPKDDFELTIYPKLPPLSG